MSSSIVDQLETVFSQTGPAHHAAFAETDGFDPEWALWYADHTLAEVRATIGDPDLTQSRLVWAIVSADDHHSSSEEPWPRFYAEHIVELLSR